MSPPTSRDRRGRDLRWWTAPEDKHRAGAALWNYARNLEEQPSTLYRDEQFRRYARMYGNAEYLGLKPWQYTHRTSETRVTRNVIASVSDTLHAMIGQNRPAPQFLTNGADFDLRRKADKLNKFGKGVLIAMDFYRRAAEALLLSIVFGTSAVKVYTLDDAIASDVVFPWELLIEDADGMMRAPRTIVQRMYVPKDVVLARWPDARLAIERAQPLDGSPGDLVESDQVVMYEGWHLKSGPGKHDGRHIIALDGYATVDEEWKRKDHPFAVLRWNPTVAGFWGRGVAESLQGLQIEINRLLIKIQESMHLLGRAVVAMQMGSGVPKAHINNEIGAILTYNAGANPPTIITQPTVHPEIFQHVDRLEQKAYDQEGISQVAARSEKPAGLNSAVALETYNDIKTDRFAMRGRAYEEFHMDAVRLALEEARSIKGFRVDVPDRNQKIEINWKDVRLDESEYVLQCWPMSILPQTPAGRVQAVENLLNLGAIPPDYTAELLNIPDLERIKSLATARRQFTESRIACILDEDVYKPADPRFTSPQELEYLLAVSAEEEAKGCPDEKLDMLRDLQDEMVEILKPAAQPPAQEQPAQGQAAPVPVAAAPPMAA